MKHALFCFSIFLCLVVTPRLQAQEVESSLEKLMVKYEEKVLQVYQEMQALEQSPITKNEKAAFDLLLSGYTMRVLEIYETLERIKNFTLENYRIIAARALVLRALSNLDVAQGDPTKIENACKDYRSALSLTRSSKVPVINQSLPYEIWIGDRLYTRLADLLDDKDHAHVLLACMQSSGN